MICFALKNDLRIVPVVGNGKIANVLQTRFKLLSTEYDQFTTGVRFDKTTNWNGVSLGNKFL